MDACVEAVGRSQYYYPLVDSLDEESATFTWYQAMAKAKDRPLAFCQLPLLPLLGKNAMADAVFCRLVAMMRALETKRVTDR